MLDALIRRAAAIVAAALVVLAVGCGSKVALRQAPPWYDPEIRTVAVAQFANRSLQPLAGLYTSERVAAALAENGTYRVIGPRELKRRLAEAGTKLIGFDSPAAVAEVVSVLPEVDAVLVGAVTRFDVDQYTYTGYGHQFFFGLSHAGFAGHHRGYFGGEYPYVYNRYLYPINDFGGAWSPVWYRVYGRAEIEASAALVRTADGTAIDSTIDESVAQRSSRYYSGAHRIMREAVDTLAARIVATFAITDETVRIDQSKALRTAVRRGEHLTFTDDIEADGHEVVAVVQLPPAAADNPFSLVLTRKGQDVPLAERSFMWAPGWVEMELTFPAEEFDADAVGDFEFTLSSGRQKVAATDFEIE